MANAARLRELLTFVEDNPALFDVHVWAIDAPGGIVADLAGRALLLSHWTLAGDNEFLSPDGKRLIHHSEDIASEAQALLGLTDDELWNNGDLDHLFALDADAAVARLRELTEEAEAVAANA